MITIYILCCLDYLTLSQYSKFKTISLFCFLISTYIGTVIFDFMPVKVSFH